MTPGIPSFFDQGLSMGICFIVFFRFSISLPAVDGLVGICAVLDSDAIESVRFVLALA